MEEVNKLGKILIVDDNEDVLFALNLLLEPYTEKIKVATTPDRIERIKLYERLKPVRQILFPSRGKKKNYWQR